VLLTCALEHLMARSTKADDEIQDVDNRVIERLVCVALMLRHEAVEKGTDFILTVAFVPQRLRQSIETSEPTLRSQDFAEALFQSWHSHRGRNGGSDGSPPRLGRELLQRRDVGCIWIAAGTRSVHEVTHVLQ